MEVITPVIKVDVGESQQTVKGLKKEISELKDRILNLTKGTDEYNEAVGQLQERQRTLNEVMALTKKEAVAVEGSYDALTHQMALLRKEWKATADEARRNEIGQQIAEINAQLKEMDASVGNFQRNVGNYVSHWEGMPDAVDDFGDSVSAAAAAPKDFGTAMREMNEQIEPTKQKFEAVGKISSGVASGFAAVQGTMALLNIESENLEKALVKVQSAMAIAQGVKGIGDLVEGVGKAKVAFAGLIDKVKAVSKAMGAAGWIAVIVAVTTAIIALVSWIKKTKEESDGLAVSLEEQKEASDKLRESYIDVVGEYRLFQREYSKLDTNEEKINWINENASAFEKMGLNIKTVNDADEAFVRQSTAVIAALKARARAEAATELYKKKFGEIEAQKDAYVTPIPASSVQGSATDAGNGKFPAELKGYEDYYYVADGYYQGGTVAYMRKEGVTDEDLRNSPAGQARKTQDFAAFNAQLAYFEALLSTEEEAALKAEAALGNLFKDNKGDNNSPKILTKEEALALAQAEIDKVTEEQMAALDVIEIEEEKPKKPLYEYKEGDAEKRAKIRISQEERIANRQIELNNMAEQSEEERAAKEFEIRQALEQKKLDLLKKFREQALAEGDILGAEELAQQIADKEIEIEKAKYDELQRLREQDKEKRLKALNDVSTALSTAGQITQGIMEITQAQAEKDGEINEREAKRIKGLQYATGTINMLQGAISAYSAAQSIPAPFGQIIGAANAAAVIAMGTANLMKIKNTDLTGSVSTGAMGAVTPNSNVFGTDIPISYTRQITGASETDKLNEPIKVYVTESDITNAVNHSKARIEESSF